MRKLGKASKQTLISGIIITIVGVGLFVLNFNLIPIVCVVSGLMLVVIGTPYINGVEHPHMLEEEQQKRNLELASKREYVKNNIHKFAIGTNDKSQVNIDKPQSSSILSQITYEQENQEIGNTTNTLNTMQHDQKGQVLTKKLTPSKNIGNK